ncbi:potassium-transporting ATPase subunit KdpC [Xanthomonas rydalmerensis]|uniref:Potassium-transporting ATPase KdpC subunit n=2 Tax=Xanthomonas rydalmerensis TaxID=3046274 RepID=A0ABZ0JTH4_9XANT|nr:potassium-transporting ATPase subunit KdpC [Xanthomonas sp. DM-2023]WOS43045.1 potassium-transporting ATPase subunit KdpC [Xanthomonas sp. DM-2023]WOS47227.1 potassium-transporting ATPase subunit KdpC [Xanthomonas sp. DM-2023]WOS51407.1 potassium-transporting ATPase subunit KdpC [Xanthomonas sp. DM-2023]WOS55590.1 potassium-transporting ATPase subunit KdpC [Xanthomonas sp. DM-2023]WOS59770.1 potassium-transporting ATPase subunit KdpC [Xanthomonas sp. DM-2023]
MRWRAVLVLPLLVLASAALYSLLATVLAGALFPAQANGSLHTHAGRVVGSALVAQPFAAAGYFQPRPSGAKYDPMSAAGSNQARSNPDLRKRLDDTRQAVAAREGIDPAQVPDDLVTQSGSGMDPDISVDAAQIQVARVAAARGLPPQTVAALVAAQTQPRQFGVLGEPRVNVLALNLALDADGNGETGIGNGQKQ